MVPKTTIMRLKLCETWISLEGVQLMNLVNVTPTSGHLRSWLTHHASSLAWMIIDTPEWNTAIITFITAFPAIYKSKCPPRAHYTPIASHSWIWFSTVWSGSLESWSCQNMKDEIPFNFFQTKSSKQTGQIVLYSLTREMSWHSWCFHENGDTLGWRTESLPPCWYKLCLDYSCAAGLNIRPHLEDKTAEACKNEKQGERLARLTPCFLVTTVWAGGAVLWLFIWFFGLVSHKRFMS